MSQKINVYQAAQEILQLTNDGGILIPCHLQLVENAVNGFLDEAGLVQFQNLLETSRAGYTKSRSLAIAKLNDELRTTFNSTKGQIILTQGFSGLSENDRASIYQLVKSFNQFSKDNDPYGEHDMGKVVHNGEKVFWKIDYYDPSLTYGSEDPADPDLTKRVLTIMLAHEY